MASEFDYVFEGDGRELVEPLPEWQMPGNPVPVRRATARMLGRMFDEQGSSHHSPNNNTTWVAVAYAQYKGFGIEYKTDEWGGAHIYKTH